VWSATMEAGLAGRLASWEMAESADAEGKR
jgi:hypothetical protein